MVKTISKNTAFCFVAYLASHALPYIGVAQTDNSLVVTSEIPPEEKDPLSLNASLSTGRLLIQEEASGQERYSVFGLKLGYQILEKTSLTLGQGLSYTPEDSASQVLIREEDNNVQLGTTRLTIAQDLAEVGQFKFAAEGNAGWYHAEYYQDLTRYADAGLALSATWKPLEWLSYSLSPEYTAYFHEETMANTASGVAAGEANSINMIGLAQGLSISPPQTKGLSLALSYTNLRIDYYGNKETGYLYATSAALTYQATDKFTVNAGISNLNNQIANDRVAAVVLSNKDSTIFQMGLGYKVF